jgi:hypothetical protein
MGSSSSARSSGIWQARSQRIAATRRQHLTTATMSLAPPDSPPWKFLIFISFNNEIKIP